MTDASQLSAQEMEGSLVRLELQQATNTLLKHFEDPRMMVAIQQEGEMTKARLQKLVSEKDLWAYKVTAMGEHIGYVLVMFYHGPVYCSFYTFDPAGPSVEYLEEVMEITLPVFFGLSTETALYYYHPHPVPDEVHSMLVDTGWDYWPESPIIDNDVIACYIMWRFTYDAYHGEGEEEFEEYDEGDDY